MVLLRVAEYEKVFSSRAYRSTALLAFRLRGLRLTFSVNEAGGCCSAFRNRSRLYDTPNVTSRTGTVDSVTLRGALRVRPYSASKARGLVPSVRRYPAPTLKVLVVLNRCVRVAPRFSCTVRAPVP